MTLTNHAPLTTRAALLAQVSERTWQRQVIEWAHRAGWLVAHTHDSRKQEWGTDAGVPDLLIAKDGEPLWVVELKTQTGRVSNNQQRWLDALSFATDVYAPIWRPGDEEIVRRSLGV